jgi:hypothetical protein
VMATAFHDAELSTCVDALEDFSLPLLQVLLLLKARHKPGTLNLFSSQMLQLKAHADGKGGGSGAGAAAAGIARSQDSSYDDLVTTEKLRLLADAQKRTIEALKSELISQVRVKGVGVE